MTTIHIDGKERPEAIASDNGQIHIVWEDFYIILEPGSPVFFKHHDNMQEGKFGEEAVKLLFYELRN